MEESVLCSLIAVCGVIVGAILSFVSQLIINKIGNKKDKQKITYTLKIEVYADAIRYITWCCRVYQHRNKDDYKKISEEAESLYDKFHPLLTIIAPDQMLDSYNKLRNEAMDGKIDAAEGYRRVVSILNFNINND